MASLIACFSDILDNMPEYSIDIRANFRSIIEEYELHGMNESQFCGVLLTSAFVTRNRDLIDVITEKSSEYINDDQLNEIKEAISAMSLTNIYFRLEDHVTNQDYKKLGMPLSIPSMRKKRDDHVGFLYYTLATSILNDCSTCINVHVRELEKLGISQKSIQFVSKIVAVIHACSQMVFIE